MTSPLLFVLYVREPLLQSVQTNSGWNCPSELLMRPWLTCMWHCQVFLDSQNMPQIIWQNMSPFVMYKTSSATFSKFQCHFSDKRKSRFLKILAQNGFVLHIQWWLCFRVLSWHDFWSCLGSAFPRAQKEEEENPQNIGHKHLGCPPNKSELLQPKTSFCRVRLEV